MYTIRIILLHTAYAATTFTDMKVLMRVNESRAHCPAMNIPLFYALILSYDFRFQNVSGSVSDTV